MPYTVSFNEDTEKQLETLRMKLGAKNKPEALAKAMRLAQLYVEEVVENHGKLVFEKVDGSQETVRLL